MTSKITEGIHYLLSTLQNHLRSRLLTTHSGYWVSLSCNTDICTVFVYAQIPNNPLRGCTRSTAQTPTATSFLLPSRGSRVKFGVHYLNKAPFGQPPPPPEKPRLPATKRDYSQSGLNIYRRRRWRRRAVRAVRPATGPRRERRGVGSIHPRQ